MTYGTAGLTAAASVKKITDLCNFNSDQHWFLEQQVVLDQFLWYFIKLGVEVHAITGKPDESEVYQNGCDENNT